MYNKKVIKDVHVQFMSPIKRKQKVPLLKQLFHHMVKPEYPNNLKK